MISIPLLLAYVGAASLLTITPGVDTALVLRSAAADGRRPAMLAAVGTAIGCLTWGAAASLGLGVILSASELAYTAVKFVGAGYLIWQGLKLVFRPRTSLSTGDQRARASGLTALRRGFLTNILNPKVGIFYVTFLPQFVPHGVNVGLYSFLLTVIHALLIVLWFSIVVAATGPLGGWLRKGAVVKRLDRLTGSVFIAFGLKLAVSPANR